MATKQLQTVGDFVNVLTEADINYGLRGQLNIKLPRKPNESKSMHGDRTREFANALVKETGMNPDDVFPKTGRGEQIVINNPNRNARLIIDGLGLAAGDVAFDKISGRTEGKVGVRFDDDGKQTLKVVRALEQETDYENPNILGKHSRREIDRKLAPSDTGPRRS